MVWPTIGLRTAKEQNMRRRFSVCEVTGSRHLAERTMRIDAAAVRGVVTVSDYEGRGLARQRLCETRPEKVKPEARRAKSEDWVRFSGRGSKPPPHHQLRGRGSG